MNPDILQYRKELLTAAPKNRKAKRMLCKEFDLSLQPLLEDIPSPTYQDLVDAFGSPSHMAQTLLDSIHVPPPLSCKQKLGIALGIVCTILCIIFLIFYSFNRPENDLSFGDVSDYPLSRLCDEFVFVALKRSMIMIQTGLNHEAIIITSFFSIIQARARPKLPYDTLSIGTPMFFKCP